MPLPFELLIFRAPTAFPSSKDAMDAYCSYNSIFHSVAEQDGTSSVSSAAVRMGIIKCTDLFILHPGPSLFWKRQQAASGTYIWPVIPKNFAIRSSVLRPGFNIFLAIVLPWPVATLNSLFGDFKSPLINVIGDSTSRLFYCINFPRISPNKFADTQN